MERLVGRGDEQVVQTLRDRVSTVAAGAVDQPRALVLQMLRGAGKSRVVRELHRPMRAGFDPEGYWPALQELSGDVAASRDPLPGRKRIGPDPYGFVWPPYTHPGFAWWQFHCERMQGCRAVDVAAQAKPDLERHIIPLTLASKEGSARRSRRSYLRSPAVGRDRGALAA